VVLDIVEVLVAVVVVVLLVLVIVTVVVVIDFITFVVMRNLKKVFSTSGQGLLEAIMRKVITSGRTPVSVAKL